MDDTTHWKTTKKSNNRFQTYTFSGKLPPGAKWVDSSDGVRYVYKNEAGDDMFVVFRQEAWHRDGSPVINEDSGKQVKRFIQNWFTKDHKKPKGARKLLYPLPELLKDIKGGHTIFVVEGERKVTLLRNWGFKATCAPEGAGKWYPEHAELLRGVTHTVIVPDNDEAGRRHADMVGKSLEDIGQARHLLELPDLPEHGDVCDWANAGGTQEQFKELAQNTTRPWEPYYKEDDPDLGVWDAGDDVELPPPRGWLLGNIFARKFLSSLFGDGGVGKTALRYAQLLSLAIDRSLTGDHVFQRCRVLIISLEDDADELRRRIAALCLHYGIDRAELKGWLFLSAPGARKGKLMTLDKRGRLKEGKLAAMIEAEVIKHNIDIVSIDPFVKSHSVEENANTMIDEVAQVLVGLGYTHNIAVDSPHHIAKGPADPGNANRGRGASALKDAARLVYTLTPMSADEAAKFKLPETEWRSLVRMDSGKVNITPPLHMARWYKLVGVKLGNTTEIYPNGDEVQAVEQWFPPDAWQDFSDTVMNLILADIDAGLPDGVRYSHERAAKARAAWKVVVKHAPDKGEVQAREIIKTWVENQTLLVKEYRNEVARKDETGLWWNPAKKPPTTQELPF